MPSSHVEDEGFDGRIAGLEPKCPRMASEGDGGMPDAATPEYASWAHWRNIAGSIAMRFMEAEDIGVMAANFQMQVMQQGLSVAGVDRMCQWAAPDMDQTTALAHMAMDEKAEPYVLDVAVGARKRRTVQGQPSYGPGASRPQAGGPAATRAATGGPCPRGDTPASRPHSGTLDAEGTRPVPGRAGADTTCPDPLGLAAGRRRGTEEAPDQ